MAIKGRNFEQSDVTFWGMGAMAAAGIAVLSTSIGAFVPAGVFGSLHANRLEGGTLNQLRAQVEQLNVAQRDLLSTTNQLRSQFTLAERNRTQFNQRVGALEVSIPMLLEVVPPGTEIDPLSITASIEDPNSVSFEAEGGSVTVVQTPLFAGSGDDDTASPAPDQPIVPQLNTPDENTTPNMAASGEAGATESGSMLPLLSNLGASDAGISLSQTRFGIAVGPPILQTEADALWADISGKIGTLLIGLEPAISDPLQNDSYRVVLGPISNFSEAATLCQRITLVGIDCLPIQYADPEISSL